jgi:hypothetical protein
METGNNVEGAWLKGTFKWPIKGAWSYQENVNKNHNEIPLNWNKTAKDKW